MCNPFKASESPVLARNSYSRDNANYEHNANAFSSPNTCPFRQL